CLRTSSPTARNICWSRSRSRSESCCARTGASSGKSKRVDPKAKARVPLKDMAASVKPAQVQELLAMRNGLIRIKPILYKLRYKQKRTLLEQNLADRAARWR